MLVHIVQRKKIYPSHLASLKMILKKSYFLPGQQENCCVSAYDYRVHIFSFSGYIHHVQNIQIAIQLMYIKK